MMTRSKQNLYSGAALLTLLVCLSGTAQAQYHILRSDQPSVEIDLGALEDAPAQKPAPWQRNAPEELPPPITATPALRAPIAAPAPSQPAAPVAAAPIQQPPVRKKILKPLFAEPIAPPPALIDTRPVVAPAPVAVQSREPAMPQKAAPAPVPRKAATPRKPYNPYLGAPVDTAAEAPLTPPPQRAAPVADVALPVKKPVMEQPEMAELETIPAPIAPQQPPVQAARIPAPAQPPAVRPVMSYPPAQQAKPAIQHFDRPVLPVIAVDTPVEPPVQAVAPVTPSAPAQDMMPDVAVIKPARKPLIQDLPETVLSADELNAIPEAALPTTNARPARKPEMAAVPVVTTEAEETKNDDVALQMPETGGINWTEAALNDDIAPADTSPLDMPADIAAPAPVIKPIPEPTPATAVATARPSLITTDAPPPPRPAAVPAPKPFENRPALSDDDLHRITGGMEDVPVQVAMAPPAPALKTTVVPTLADLTLEFDALSSDLSQNTQQKLMNVVPHLTEDENRRLQIRAYAAGEDGSKSSAKRIALSRGLAVRSFLMDNGIKPTRVIVRAMGLETDRQPLERVDLVFAK